MPVAVAKLHVTFLSHETMKPNQLAWGLNYYGDIQAGRVVAVGKHSVCLEYANGDLETLPVGDVHGSEADAVYARLLRLQESQRDAGQKMAECLKRIAELKVSPVESAPVPVAAF